MCSPLAPLTCTPGRVGFIPHASPSRPPLALLASFTPLASLTRTGDLGGSGGCERVQCPGPGHPGPPMMSAL